MNIEKSCLECIWCEQCGDISPCEYFDDGKQFLNEEEIEIVIEQSRTNFKAEYEEYLNEWSNGI